MIRSTAQPLVVKPTRGFVHFNLAELWAYRELLYFFVWRDVKVRYKQTFLGAAWALAQPLMTMVMFSVFLGRLARVPSDGVPYPLFVLSALIPWGYFAAAVGSGSNSLVGNQVLLSKVYFPRLLVPMAAVVTPLVDAGVAFGLVIVALAWAGVPVSASVLWLPVFMLLAVATALAASVWLSVLNVEYRDIRHLIPFLIQFWLFATPVVYPASLVPERWRALYALNPMSTVVEGFRWALLGTKMPSGNPLVSAGLALVVLFGGMLYFRRLESTFVDVI
jgi:lipopolysaccharide transport system permease protein